MGADMLLLTLWVENDQKKLPTQKTLDLLRNLLTNETNPDTLQDAADYVGVGHRDSELNELAREARRHDPEMHTAWINAILDGYKNNLEELEKSLDNRDVAQSTLGNLTSYSTGGISWGDSPSDTYDHWYSLLYDPYEPGYGGNPYAEEIYQTLFILANPNWVKQGIPARIATTSITETPPDPKES